MLYGQLFFKSKLKCVIIDKSIYLSYKLPNVANQLRALSVQLGMKVINSDIIFIATDQEKPYD